MTNNLRVLVVDDQIRACHSLKALLATCNQVGAIQEANDGEQALAAVESFSPDVIVMDVLMPKMNGLQTTRLVKLMWPQVKIVLLSIYSDYRANALAAGADAFVSKGEKPARLLSTVLSVAGRPH